jgi:hypothetical protein
VRELIHAVAQALDALREAEAARANTPASPMQESETFMASE